MCIRDSFLTDKKDKFLHGIGLKNIRLALEKYNGEIIIEPLDDKFILKMLIPITVSYTHLLFSYFGL